MKKKLLILLFAFFVANGYAQPGLVAYYPFTGNVADSSGNHLDGVITGGVTLTADRFGHPNSACHFDGTSGYIKCPNDSQLIKGRNVTFSVWFHVENRPGTWEQNVILSNLGYFNSSGGFQAYTSNPPGVYNSDFRNQTHTDQYLQGNDTIQLDAWYNLVVVIRHDSLPDSTTVTNYLNGITDDSSRTSGHLVYDNITQLYIGANRDISCCQRYFLGDIDEVKIFNRALTPFEVTDLVTGIKNENNFYAQPILFPNPSNGDFEIHQLPGDGILSLEIVNLAGQMVFSRQINSSEKIKPKVNLQNISPGLYVVRLKSREGIWQEKWVKQ